MESETRRTLRIGYAGHLEAWYEGQDKPASWWKRFLQFFLLTYRESEVYITADRTGMALFRHLVIFKDRYPDLVSSLSVHLWGSIDPANETHVKFLQLIDIVKITGRVTKEESDQRLAECDVVLLLLESGKNGYRPMALPSKMFDYLKIAKPVLVLSEESDCTDILRKAGIGIVCPHHGTPEVADVLRDLILNADQLQVKYVPNEKYISTFNFENKAEEIERIFDQVLSK